MIYLKNFNESTDIESEIEKYLQDNFPKFWIDSELQERVYDYIDSDEADEHGDGDHVESYKNLSTGGAIEYDLLDEMMKDVCKKFNIEYDKKINNRNVNDIVWDHLMINCDWKDSSIFNRKSTDPYVGISGTMYNDLKSKWDDLEF